MRAAGALARVFGTAVVFVLSLVAGLALHLDAPVARRLVVERVNGLLASTLDGRITIERVGLLDVTHVADVDARADDPDGITVVRVYGVSGRIALGSLMRSLVRGQGIAIEIRGAWVERAEVNLDADAAGELRIARAFTPRASTATASPPGRPVRVSLPNARAGHVLVRGQPNGMPRIDADLDDTEASVFVQPPAVAVDVIRSRMAARSLPMGPPTSEARGEVEAHFAKPSWSGNGLGLRGSFDGAIGRVATRVSVSDDAGFVVASVDIPLASPDDARSVLSDWPLATTVAVHATARGPYPVLAVVAHASAGPSTLDVGGPVTIAPLRADLRLDANALDLRSVVPSLPASDLSASGDVSVVAEAAGTIDAHGVLEIAPGRVGVTSTPAGRLTGEIVRGPPPAAGVTATATLSVREPGVPSEVRARFKSKHGSLFVSFEGDASAPRLEDVRRFWGLLHGRAKAHATGTYDGGSGQLDALVTATAQDVEVRGVSAATLRAQARASGPLLHPTIDVEAAAQEFDAGVVHDPAVQASARWDVATDTLTDADVEIEGARARAKLVRITPSEVRVDEARIEGFGSPFEASLRASSSSLFVDVDAPAIDLARVAGFIRVPWIHGGQLSLDVDGTVGHDMAEGRFALALSSGRLWGFHDASARVEVTLDGRRVSGVATARVADVGSMDLVSSSVQIGGNGPLKASSWRQAFGALDVSAHVDLPKFIAGLPPRALPIDEVRGVFDVKGHFERDSLDDVTPDVDLTARTTGLAVYGTGTAGPWRVEGIDPALRVVIDGDTGATSLSVQVFDPHGTLLSGEGHSADVPYKTILSGGDALGALRSMPFDARVDLPPRRVEDLPAVMAFAKASGDLAADVVWHGTALSPTIDGEATLKGGILDSQVFARPMDLAGTTHYDGAHATTTLKATMKGRLVLDASVNTDVRAPDVLAGLGGGAVPWTASVRAMLDRMPVQSLAALDVRQVRGHVTGDLAVDRLHRDPSAVFALTSDDLKVGEVACKAAHVEVAIDRRAMDVTADVNQGDGSLFARAHVGSAWGLAVLPSVDTSKGADILVSAKQFRAGLLLPLLPNAVTDLDGRVDGDGHVAIDPVAKTVRPLGTFELTGGVFELASLGGEFSGMSAKLTMTPDGVFRLEDMTAQSLDGKLEAAATAWLNGTGFGGARAVFQVPRTQALPIVFDGVQVGTMDGRFETSVSEPADGSALDVLVSVPTLHVQLPLSAVHDVQPLGALQGVRTGFIHRGETFVPLALDASAEAQAPASQVRPVRITISLGQDVTVKRGTTLDVGLEGSPVITVADKVSVAGQIRLLRGTIDVQGKPFEIEKGTITFAGDDPSNPQVVLTAGWTASDGTRVYADFNGPLKTGKVTLRSDPAVPGGENAILALILFGSSDQGAATGVAGASPAAGLAGGAATAPINQALGGVNTALDKLGIAGSLSTKIDTSQANPRPEVEVQIARDISLQIAWVIGLPPPDMPDSALATFDWRFLRKWSLQTTVGDRGTSILDVVWQHRY